MGFWLHPPTQGQDEKVGALSQLVRSREEGSAEAEDEAQKIPGPVIKQWTEREWSPKVKTKYMIESGIDSATNQN